MPNYVNFGFGSGETYTQPFLVYDNLGTTLQDVTEWSISLTAQVYPDTTGATWPFLFTLSAVLTDPTHGACTVTFPRADTLDLESRTYFYKLSRTDTNTEASLVEGYLFLAP